MMRADRRSAGLLVVGIMALFIGGTALISRLKSVESKADDVATAVDEANAKASEVEQRVEDLESRLGIE